MGLTALNVSIIVAPIMEHCGTKRAFTVTLFVTGNTDGNGGFYLPSVWDDDGWANADDKLVAGNRVAVIGAFANTHTYTLDCAADCEVVGGAGGSSEARAEVYGYVEEVNRMFGKLCAESGRQSVWCHTEEECPLNQTTASASHGRLRLDGLDGVRADLASLKVVSQAPPPDSYQMAFGLGIGLRAFRVGDDRLDLGSPIGVVCKLTANEMAILDKMKGQPVRFVPAEKKWVPLEDYELEEGVLRFKTQEGGLFGVAPSDSFPLTKPGPRSYRLWDRKTEDLSDK